MKIIIGFFLITSTAIFLFSSCKKDNFNREFIPETQILSYPNVPPQLWEYFKRYEEEAFIRGMDVDLVAESITAEIIEIEENGVAGTCTYGSHSPGHIEIDLTFFNQVSDNFKEMIIFHELGHCQLHRGHREGVNLDGTCVSIMRSGLEECRDNYNEGTRRIYLDELFGIEL